jgi:tripartite-type tricarboxylate transporter receptor subunit TctC
MSGIKQCAAFAFLGMMVVAPRIATAEVQFPKKPVRIVVTFSPGGAADLTARIVAEKLAERWKPYGAVVENIIGAGGNIGADAVFRAAPDGHTLLLVSNTHAINQVLYPKTPFDIARDFSPITMMTSSPIVIAVNPKSNITSIKGLSDRMVQQNGQMNYLTCGVATAHHFAMELLKNAVKASAIHVPHRGCGPAVVDAVSGQVDTVVATLPAVLPFIKQGRLTGLAVTSKARSPSTPDMPTVAESGIPALRDYAVENYYGFMAPANTPKDVLAKINADVTAVLSAPEMKARLGSAGLDLFLMSPEAMTSLLKSDIDKFRKAADMAGIHPE